MLDQQNREALGCDSAEQSWSAFFSLKLRPGAGSSSYNTVGLAASARDLDQALMAIAEARSRLVGAMAQSNEIERGASAPPKRIMSALDKRIAVPLRADNDIF
jgi:hypothetical protein